MNIKYINIPSNLLFDKNISSFAKLLYGELYVLSFKKGVCEATNNFLAEANNCSVSKIIRALKQLKDYDYIIVDESNFRKIRVVQK